MSHICRYGSTIVAKLPSMESANAGMRHVIGVSGSTASARAMSGRAADTFPDIK
jgi:hypothetical protein